MSMAEYMCKLFYGRRGIQLSEEQISSLLQNKSQNYLRFNFLDSPINKDIGKEEWFFQQNPSGIHSSEITQSSQLCIPTANKFYPPFHFTKLGFSSLTPSSAELNNSYLTLETNNQPSSHYLDPYVINPFQVPPLEALAFDQDLSRDSIALKSLEIGENYSPTKQFSDILSLNPSCQENPINEKNNSNEWINSDQKNKNTFENMTIFHNPTYFHSHSYSLLNDWNYSKQISNKVIDKDFPNEDKTCFYYPRFHEKFDQKLNYFDEKIDPLMEGPCEIMSPIVDSTSLDLNYNGCGSKARNYNSTKFFTPLSKSPFFSSMPLNEISYQNLLKPGRTIEYLKYDPSSKSFIESISSSESRCLRQSDIPDGGSFGGRSLQHVCAVCGDHAACQHYGVRTCEGCKGFFKRTVQKNAVYVCLSGKNCPIDKRRRNRCQYCRFEKCLAVGMVKEVVRTDVLKGRRGRLPSKPRLMPPVRELSLSPPVTFLTSLVRANVDSSPDKQSLIYSHFNVPMFQDSFNTTASHFSYFHLFHLVLEQTIEILAEWSSKIPGFNQLSTNDQQRLFHTSLIDLIILRISYRTETDSNNFNVTFCNGITIDYNQYKNKLAFSWLDHLVSFSKCLKSIGSHKMDTSTFSCLLALCLLNSRNGLENLNLIEKLQNSILNALHSHQENMGKGRFFVPLVVNKLTELRTPAKSVLSSFCHIAHLSKRTASNTVLDKLLFLLKQYNSFE